MYHLRDQSTILFMERLYIHQDSEIGFVCIRVGKEKHHHIIRVAKIMICNFELTKQWKTQNIQPPANDQWSHIILNTNIFTTVSNNWHRFLLLNHCKSGGRWGRIGSSSPVTRSVTHTTKLMLMDAIAIVSAQCSSSSIAIAITGWQKR